MGRATGKVWVELSDEVKGRYQALTVEESERVASVERRESKEVGRLFDGGAVGTAT